MIVRAVLALALVASVGLPAVAEQEPAPKTAAWFAAARDGDVATLRKLAGRRSRATLDATDERGYSALILAAYHDHAPAVRWLLARGASTCTADLRGFTALMGAVFRGHDAIVRTLAYRPCGADHVTAAGQTPLMLAALFGRMATVRILLSHGADPARVDLGGFDARRLAATQGNRELIALLDAALAR